MSEIKEHEIKRIESDTAAAAAGSGAAAAAGWVGVGGIAGAGAQAQRAPVLRHLYFFKKILGSAKVTQRQRRVYDLRHFRAGAKVAQNRRSLCSRALSRLKS